MPLLVNYFHPNLEIFIQFDILMPRYIFFASMKVMVLWKEAVSEIVEIEENVDWSEQRRNRVSSHIAI